MQLKNNVKIEHEKPAARWHEAYPLGNGQIGAMVYMDPLTEVIHLSENTFYSGEKSSDDNQEGAARAFSIMRECTKKHDYPGAMEASQSFIGRRNNYGTNLPVGQIIINDLNQPDIWKFGRDNFRSEHLSNYRRSLDLMCGVARAEWTIDKKQYQSEAFASHPDKVLVWQRSCNSRDMQLSIGIIFNSILWKMTYNRHGSYLAFETQALESIHSDGKTGVRLWGRLYVETDGCCIVEDELIIIKDASRAALFVIMETDFVGELINEEEIKTLLDNRYRQVEKSNVDELKKRHIDDLGSLMQQSLLYIESKKKSAVDLIPLMYQLGRYLLISSSRCDSWLPAHLQGIWNDNVACRIGWTCDMHLDINTQMNYWPVVLTGLDEAVQPLFRWIEEELVPSGRISAKTSYGLDGWTAELVSNAWSFTAPYWASAISPCPTGGVWIMTHMWDYWEKTNDLSFLRERAYPVIEEAVRFFIDYVFEDENGYVTSGPSISPENSFIVDGKTYQISNGCTYEILMIRELFDIYGKAGRLLGEEGKLQNRVKTLLPKLLPYRIRDDGLLAEWAFDYEEADPWHRHTSHLLGVYPFRQITSADEKLAAAVRKTIQFKTADDEKWEDTGWARSMMMLYCASLGDGEGAWSHIDAMLKKLLETNYFIIHPPTRGAPSFDNVYELDGNTGLTTCIAHMLMQSEPGVIRILPALPGQWANGSISGLAAAGGIKVGIEWRNGMLCKVHLKSKCSSEIDIEYRGKRQRVMLDKHLAVTLDY